MNYCSRCGQAVTLHTPDGDSRARYVCSSCGMIHYANPLNVVGTISIWQGKVLMSRRAITPRYGWWTLPAGFLEEGETTREGAARETFEETGVHVTVGELFAIAEVRQINHVYLIFIAELQDTHVAPGSESLEVRLFDESEIPWDIIAFPAIAGTLRSYFDDRAIGKIRDRTFRVHMFEMDASVVD